MFQVFIYLSATKDKNEGASAGEIACKRMLPQAQGRNVSGNS